MNITLAEQTHTVRERNVNIENQSHIELLVSQQGLEEIVTIKYIK